MDALWPSQRSSYHSDSRRQFLTSIEKCLFGDGRLDDLILCAECMCWRKKLLCMRVVGRACEGQSHELYSAQRVLIARRLVQNNLWNQVYASLQPVPTTSADRVAMIQNANRTKKAAVSTTRLPKLFQ